MTDPDTFLDEIAKIVEGDRSSIGEDERVSAKFSWSTIDEAKVLLKEVRHKQKQIQSIKQRVNQEIKEIRQEYKGYEANVQPPGGLTGFFMGKGQKRSSVARGKRSVAQRRDEALKPYESIKVAIDDLLVQMDGMKIALEKSIQEGQVK